jgi:hypothetical protein
VLASTRAETLEGGTSAVCSESSAATASRSWRRCSTRRRRIVSTPDRLDARLDVTAALADLDPAVGGSSG